jgi:hypothetical protein
VTFVQTRIEAVVRNQLSGPKKVIGRAKLVVGPGPKKVITDRACETIAHAEDHGANKKSGK